MRGGEPTGDDGGGNDGRGDEGRGDDRIGGDGNFLKRWSRRKHESARAVAPPVAAPGSLAGEPVAPQPGDVAQAGGQVPGAAAPRPLPDTATLDGLRSEYSDFLKPDVDEGVRRAALKKLFADPHFAGMDPIEFYSQDYTHPDPIPAAMLAKLNQARGLLFPHEDEKPAEGGDPAAAVDAAPAWTEPDSPADPQAQAASPAPPEPGSDAVDAGKSGASG